MNKLNITKEDLVVSPNNLDFLVVSPQTLSITSAYSDRQISWMAMTETPWIELNASSGTTPSVLTVSVNTAGLSNTTHDGSVIILNQKLKTIIPVKMIINITK